MTPQTTPRGLRASSTTKRLRAIAITIGAASIVLSACGGGKGASGNSTGGSGHVTGLVVKGTVANADVTAYRLDATLTRGSSLASTTSAADGTFSITIPPYNGALEIVATGGSYSDEAVGSPVQLTSELSTAIASFQSGGTVNVTLSPVSTIARYLAKSEVQRVGSSPSDAITNAWTHVNAHFGALTWQTIVPTNITPSSPIIVTLSDQTKAGLILAGFSRLARTLAEASSLTPGTVVTASTLSGAAASDATDGKLDGAASSTTLAQGTQTLTGQTFRNGLARAIVGFVNTPYNKTQLTGDDVFTMANTISANSDSYLFSSTGTPLTFEAPAITFITPPTFVGSTTVSLQLTATQPDVGVSAVHAQNITQGGTTDGTLATGVWTIADMALLEGANLIKVWAVDGSGAGTIADAVSILITRDTTPPSPSLRTNVLSYADERTMTLQDETVPPTYVVTPTKSDVLVAGVYKAATRLSWDAAPSTTVLESSNPSNVPFVQIQVPVGAQEAPIASATYSISDGTNTYTGDLLPWVSPTSTNTSQRYDLPLSANIIASLATTATTPITLSISATVVDSAGNSSGLISLGTVPLNVIGPPVFVAQDTAYSTYNDLRSTFPYTIAGANYPTLWNSSSNAFSENQVRLVRYIISNPTPVPVAVSAAFAQDAGGSWRAVEQWTTFDGGGVPGTGTCGIQTVTPSGCSWSTDGFSFYDYWEVLTGGTNTGSCPTQAGVPSANVHWIGSGTRYTSGSPSRWTTPVADAWTPFSSATVQLGLYQGSLTSVNNDVVHLVATNTAGLFIVPAANGSVPGTAVLYLTRPLAATRTRSLGWNAITAGNRYEATEAYFWTYAASHGYSIYRVAYCNYDDYRAHRGATWLTSARDEVYGTLNLTTAGLTNGSVVIGQTQPRFATTLAGSIGSH